MKLSGYSLKEVTGKEFSFFFDHKVRKFGRSSQYEANLISKKGKKIPLLISDSPTKDGGTIGIFTNLSKLKKLSRQEKIAEYIIRNSTEAIVVLSKDRKIKLWNTGATKIFGYKENEVLNQKIDIIIPEEETDKNKNLIKEVENVRHINNIETERLAKDGTLVELSISITKVTDEKGHFIGFLLIYLDITKQNKVDSELQKRFEAIQDAYKELGIQKRQADYIYEIVELAVSKGSLKNVENLIVSATCMLTKCDAVILRSYDKEKNILKYQTSIGIQQKKALAKNHIQFENSLSKDAIKKKRPLIIHNITSSRKHQTIKLLKANNFKTLILLPLFVENEFLGTLSLYATDPGKFRLIEKEFLERFSKQCSLALYVKTR